jgi:hypothetical protein
MPSLVIVAHEVGTWQQHAAGALGPGALQKVTKPTWNGEMVDAVVRPALPGTRSERLPGRPSKEDYIISSRLVFC